MSKDVANMIANLKQMWWRPYLLTFVSKYGLHHVYPLVNIIFDTYLLICKDEQIHFFMQWLEHRQSWTEGWILIMLNCTSCTMQQLSCHACIYSHISSVGADFGVKKHESYTKYIWSYKHYGNDSNSKVDRKIKNRLSSYFTLQLL